jgi:hypothetical protein
MNYFLLFFFLLVPLAFAHLDAGQDILENGYAIDFGYAPENLSTTENTVIAFSLANATTQTPLNYTSVWVRIADKNTIIFSGTLHPENALEEQTSFSYLFSKIGMYEITLRFFQGNTTLVEHTFTIQVAEKNAGISAYVIIGVGIAILLIVLFSFKLVSRRHRKKK